MGLLRRRTGPDPVRKAWAAYDGGDQERGIALLRDALSATPRPSSWFDLGLMHKWRQEWPECLAANLEAARLEPGMVEACWNGAIAATALSDWPTARRLWGAYGVPPLAGDGEPTETIATTPVRVGGDDGQEVVWCSRLDPARARIENVPTPGCDRRWGDVVLHDGVPNGERFDGAAWQPVFDEILLWRRSETPRLAVTLTAPGPGAVEELVDAVRDAGWGAEDWTSSVRVLCRACSEGRPDGAHDHPPMDDWQDGRSVGLACPHDVAVAMLDRWAGEGPGWDWRDLEQVD